MNNKLAATEPAFSACHEAGDLMTASTLAAEKGSGGRGCCWTAGFLAFPIAGVAGRTVAGRVDSPIAALAGRAHHRCRHRCWPVVGEPRPPQACTVDPGVRRWAWELGCCSARQSSGSRPRLPTSLSWVQLTGLMLGVAQTLALPAQNQTTLVVGCRDAATVGARLDRHHSRRDSRRGAVHHLRSKRGCDVLCPLRVCCCTGSCPCAATPAAGTARVERRCHEQHHEPHRGSRHLRHWCDRPRHPRCSAPSR